MKYGILQPKKILWLRQVVNRWETPEGFDKQDAKSLQEADTYTSLSTLDYNEKYASFIIRLRLIIVYCVEHLLVFLQFDWVSGFLQRKFFSNYCVVIFAWDMQLLCLYHNYVSLRRQLQNKGLM